MRLGVQNMALYFQTFLIGVFFSQYFGQIQSF